MMKIYHDEDASLDVLKTKKIAIIGYGNQGHAHALNLKDSGMNVRIGLRAGSGSSDAVRNAHLTMMQPAEVTAWADMVMLLIPDEKQKEVFETDLLPHLCAGKILCLAHGFSIHFKQIIPPSDVDVVMIAPKSPGRMVRREYLKQSGVPCLIAIHQDVSGQAREIALAYAKAIGGTRAGVIETSFREETETDLFGEQAVLCGGLTSLIQAGFETLVEAGYAPEMAYFECLHETKLIVDLIYEGGFTRMRSAISNTAEFGDYVSGPRVIGDSTKNAMKQILSHIRSGEFAQQWVSENQKGLPHFTQCRKSSRTHLIETVGADLRSKMKFPTQE